MAERLPRLRVRRSANPEAYKRQQQEAAWLRIKELRAGGLGPWIVDKSTHPNYFVSAWPVGRSHDTLGVKATYRAPSLNFNSVLVVVLSNEYCEGVWWRLQDMLAYTEGKGFTVAFEEVDDPSYMPSDAIGIMRACAAQLALDAGFEWCFMVDTDVHLEKDTLIRLIDSDRSVVYPLIIDKEDRFMGAPLMSPKLQPGMGLMPVKWSCMSAMLFNSKVFNCLDAYAWHGHDWHFAQCLNHWGHRIYVDTDTVVNVVRGPTRHQSKSWDKLWGDMKNGFERRQTAERDRRPPPGFDPAFSDGFVDRDGVYWGSDVYRYSGVYGPASDEMLDEHDAAWKQWEAEQAQNGEGLKS